MTDSTKPRAPGELLEFRLEVNQKFEDVDRRFEEVDRRFDDVNARIEHNGERLDELNVKFDELLHIVARNQARTEAKFELMFAQFDTVMGTMVRMNDQVNNRFDNLIYLIGGENRVLRDGLGDLELRVRRLERKAG